MNSQSPLIEPKQIEIRSQIHNVTKKYQIGYYTTMEGAELISMAVEALAIGMKTSKDNFGTFSKQVPELANRMCSYVEAESNGHWVRLSTPDLIDNHVPDYEVLMKLMWEVHDYNAKSLKSGVLFQKCLTLTQGAESQLTKILTGLSGSSSMKN